MTNERIGDLLIELGKLPEALDNFRAALAVRERLAVLAPDNAGWQHDLSISYQKIAGVAGRAGKLPEALESYGAGIAIAERLARVRSLQRRLAA